MGEPVDTFQVPGIQGLIPVAGDWNGDGIDDIGLYASGWWLRDINGNRTLDDADWAALTFYGGSGLLPVPGDWNGDGRDNLGVYAPSGPFAGTWALDADGNETLDFPGDIVTYGLGISGLTPVVGDWNGDGNDDVGVYASGTALGGKFTGTWVLDVNADGVFNDVLHQFGSAGDVPVAGNWKEPLALRLESPPVSLPVRASGLTQADLQPVVETAIFQWVDAGVSGSNIERIEVVTVSIADLSGSYLAITSPTGIVIDVNAAGYGWFVDPTPLRNEEFAGHGDDGILDGVGVAGSHVDLLTVVRHELGHVLGLAHDSGVSVMNSELPVGVRRTLQSDLVDAAFSSGWDDFLLE